jgi:hypothetical protein
LHPNKNKLILLLVISALPAAASEFLWLSDIHFDPLADRTLVDKLAAAEPAQWEGILAGGSLKFPPYGRDTNWPLFSSALQAATKTQPNAAFTMVTGDLLVHHFREQFNAAATAHDDEAFRSFVRKSMEFVGLELKQRSPNKPVFITLGNNDDECGDYAIQPDGPFLKDTSKIVADLAALANTDSWVHYGSYSVANPALKHERIIVLNTVFFSPRYTDRCGQSGGDAGERLLAWLSGELATAKSRHEKVWLVYHIPPGVDAYATAHAKTPGSLTLLWKDSYTSKFVSLLEQYPGVVSANFAGHLHVEDFRLLGGSLKTSPFVIIGPAMSPITGQNPTFRTVDFDSQGNLKDQATYYLQNLTDVGKDSLPVWQLEYDFEKEWRLKNLNAQSYAALFARIGDSPAAAARWTILYSTSHAAIAIAPDSFRQFYCAAGGVTAQAYQSCVAQK